MRERVMISMRVDADVLARLRARSAEVGLSVTGLLELGATRLLADPPVRSVAALPKTLASVQRKRRTAPEPPAVTPLCRCGHVEASHWTRGCVAGCPCRRYRAVA